MIRVVLGLIKGWRGWNTSISRRINCQNVDMLKGQSRGDLFQKMQKANHSPWVQFVRYECATSHTHSQAGWLENEHLTTQIEQKVHALYRKWCILGEFRDLGQTTRKAGVQERRIGEHYPLDIHRRDYTPRAGHMRPGSQVRATRIRDV